MSETQTQNPIEQYKTIIIGRLKNAENLKGIAKATVDNLIKFIQSMGFSTWGLGIVAHNEDFVVADFKAESTDPTLNVEILHITKTISGEISDGIKVNLYTYKEYNNEVKFVIEFKRTE